MSDDPTPADVLREAANVVRTRGWCRHLLRSEDGRVCAQGAIYHAIAALGTGTQAMPPAMNALASAAGQTFDPLTGEHPAVVWNDHEAIDGEDVAVHMEKAAIRWEETAGLTEGSGRRS